LIFSDFDTFLAKRTKSGWLILNPTLFVFGVTVLETGASMISQQLNTPVVVKPAFEFLGENDFFG
jgi:hypothetical protein